MSDATESLRRAVQYGIENGKRNVIADLAPLKELFDEIDLWKPMTPEQAAKALDDAEAEPLSDERIAEIVERATDPAETLANSEQAQLAAKVIRLTATNAKLLAATTSGLAFVKHTLEFFGWSAFPSLQEAAEQLRDRMTAAIALAQPK